jgi:lipopolysaccharide transport system permease protein
MERGRDQAGAGDGNYLMEELIISARHGEKNYWRDLWRYRELLYFLAWRDLLVRYKQTVVGVAWALLRPALSIVIFTIIFSKVAKLSSDGIPYPLLVCAGTLPWQLFSNSFSDAGASLISNSNLISKIYFPRLLVPASTLAVGFVDFMISLLILFGMMVWYRFVPDIRILALPLFLLLTLGASLGAGLWLSALTVQYRDFRFIVPFLVQIGYFICPVGFSSSKVPEAWRFWYSLNPMVGAIDGFRWATLRGESTLYWPGLVGSVATTSLLLASAIYYFRRTERYFADAI